MAQQTINIGAAPNDGTGTPLRTSFDYTNQNFTELYTALGGGVGLPGATTQVIFNDGGTNLAGDAGLTYDKTTDALTVVGALSGSKLTVTGGTIPANGVYLPAANTLEFAANSLAQYRIAPLGVFSWYDGAGGTRMTLNSTGLGVGTSPQYKIHASQLVCASHPTINGSAGTILGAFLNAVGEPGIDLRRWAGSATLHGTTFIETNNLGETLFYNGIESSNTRATSLKATISANGNLLIGTSTNNANGGVLQLKSGITFPATQVAATDVNTLDDYEEGTFTPTIVGGTTAGTATYSSQLGTYTKVGRLVTFSVWIVWSGHTGTGTLNIGALPFSASFYLTSVSIGYISGITLTASNTASAYVAAGTSISIAQTPVGGGSGSNVSISASGTLAVSGSYIV